jgi:tRNA threonylcarbamoyl adenosine modification protein YeaZ
MQGRTNDGIILAIETAVLGGSLSLIRGDREIDHWIGSAGVSRSEDLLSSISDILGKNSIEKSGIASIAVSTGPGSYTGIRVGMATALGLGNALNISCKGIEVLRAMQVCKAAEDAESVSAIPIGRDEICWQVFSSAAAGDLIIGKEDRFFDFLNSRGRIHAVLHEKIFERVKDEGSFDPLGIENAGVSLARYIGLAARDKENGSGMTPVYARDFI